MKEIWINLELYFEIYEFSNFKGFFSHFSEFIFNFFMIKTNKKKEKGVDFCTGPTWMRCGTQGHVAAARGPTRRDMTCIFIFIVIIWVIVHISIPYSEFTLTPIFNAPYIPTCFF